MKWFRQLRVQIFLAQFVVVVIGVLVLLAASRILFFQQVPRQIEPILEELATAGSPEAIRAAIQVVENTFGNLIESSLVLAALGALLVGGLTALMLTRMILRPLTQMNESSERIAQGRYDERVPVPGTVELAGVATQFNHMAERLEQVEQQRVALIGNVSHELRTPLSVLQGYLEGLEDGLFPGDEETYAMMADEVARLRRLVQDLQDLSKVEAGQINLELQEFDLLPLARQISQQMQVKANPKNLTIEIDTGLPAALVVADRDRVAQILVNLVSNAIRYTPAEGKITIAVTALARTMSVAVADTGIGIPEESLPYLFERFYRVDRSRSRTSGGSGIGLTIARHLAWSMGGELSVYSAGRDMGSTFTLTLPQA